MFSYFGGKFKQSKWINDAIPHNIKNYGELFGGAMWTYIKSEINYDNAFYNDLSLYTYNMFSCFKNYTELLDVVNTKYDKLLFLDDNFMIKSIDYHKNLTFNVPDYDLCIMSLYILKHTFTQSFRYVTDIRKKQFINFFINDSEIKKYSTKMFKTLSTFKHINNNHIRMKLDKLTLFNDDYKTIAKKLDNNYDNLLLYFDPPYKAYSQKYEYQHGFDDKDHIDLAALLRSLKCKFILSYYYFDGIEDLYKNFNFYYKDYRIGINYGGDIKKKTEILISNYKFSNILLTI